MLRAKSKISVSNKERLKSINSRISEVINENRRNPAVAMGSRDWWEKVDSISQRRNSISINFDLDLLERLNDYFGKLCYDEGYTQTIDVQISHEVTVPEITKRQVWNALTKLKRTATGPDNIPFWIWKDYAELLTPVITQVWKLSLSTHTWPDSVGRGRTSTPYQRLTSQKRIRTTEASTSRP